MIYGKLCLEPKETQVRESFLRFIDTHSSMVVTREKRGGGWYRAKGVKYTATEEDLALGGRHIMQHTDDVS